MAGRDISVTHVALGTVRVMRTCGMMGEVVGMAAAVCQRKRVSPRGVYEKELDELKALMVKGIGNGKPVESQWICAVRLGRVGAYAWVRRAFGGVWVVDNEAMGLFKHARA